MGGNSGRNAGLWGRGDGEGLGGDQGRGLGEV